jgi:cytoskeletal protein CcmA (bactofilin family)
MFGTKKIDNEDISPNDQLNTASEETATGEQLAPAETEIPKSVKPSVISEGFVFDGNIKSSGQLTVEGALTGAIFVDSLIIGVNGSVGGTVNARSINVKGALTGTISCNEILIGGRSVVDGNLTYSSITIQRGGAVKGDVHKASSEPVLQPSSNT